MSSHTSPYPSYLQASYCTSTDGNSPVIPCAMFRNDQGILKEPPQLPGQFENPKCLFPLPSSDFSKHDAFLLSALMTKTICACASC